MFKKLACLHNIDVLVVTSGVTLEILILTKWWFPGIATKVLRTLNQLWLPAVVNNLFLLETRKPAGASSACWSIFLTYLDTYDLVATQHTVHIARERKFSKTAASRKMQSVVSTVLLTTSLARATTVLFKRKINASISCLNIWCFHSIIKFL